MKPLLLAAALLFSLLTLQVDAQAPKKAPRTPIADSIKAAKDSIQEKLKGSTRIDGLFTLYQDTLTGSLLLYIRKNQLGPEYIYQSFSMGGPAALFLNQNMIRETWVFGIRKKFDKLEFTRGSTAYYYDSLNKLSRAANVDVADAVFYAEKIAMKDTGGYYVNADGLFMSDKLDRVKPNFPPTLPPTAYFNLGQLNPAKSAYRKVRSFPENTDVVVELAYDNPAPMNEGGRDITDARYVTVKMQHSFLKMPVNDYKPRPDDPRVGYFTQEYDDMTTTAPVNYRDLINRWHLKKKDPKAALSEPVEPIVWWVENTTPVAYRDIIVEAGLKWNEAFEKAGFKNAVQMKIMPDTASWDPADIRYNVIRWVSSDLGYAIGPSFVNPRTGQILGADITIDYGMMKYTMDDQDLFEAFTGLTGQGMHQAGKVSHHWRNCAIAGGLKAQFALGKAVVDMDRDDQAKSDSLTRQFLTMLILHEMGHTMGLNHNMKASQMLSPEELRNPEITRTMGVMASVMDYDAVNVSLDRTKQGDYYTTKTGPYDWWAIEYGYKPFAPGEEEKELNSILSRSTDPKLAFGNDADIAFWGSGIDPRIQIWDMSNDMVAYSTDRFMLVNNMVGKLKDRYARPNQSYQELVNKYNALRYQRFSMANALSRYIGGVYVDRSFPGQNAMVKPYTPVPVDYQKKALQTIGTYIFAPNAFEADSYLFPYLQNQRRGFWFFGNPEDPKPERYVLSMQSMVMGYLLHPVTLKRINSSTLYGNTYMAADVLKDVSGLVFDADMRSDVNLYRQNLQTDYVNRLAAILADHTQFDQASKAAVLHTLRNLRSDLKKARSGNEQTQAHRAHLVHMIDKALVIK